MQLSNLIFHNGYQRANHHYYRAISAKDSIKNKWQTRIAQCFSKSSRQNNIYIFPKEKLINNCCLLLFQAGIPQKIGCCFRARIDITTGGSHVQNCWTHETISCELCVNYQCCNLIFFFFFFFFFTRA